MVARFFLWCPVRKADHELDCPRQENDERENGDLQKHERDCALVNFNRWNVFGRDALQIKERKADGR